jgi:thioredoxin 1
MKKLYQKHLFLSMILLGFMILTGCAQNPSNQNLNNSLEDKSAKEKKYLVTFIELGSVRCIPCQKMTPIMKSIKEKYGTQVKVVFHDVWTEEGKPFADKYNIRAIPTQVFLDKDGKEFFRHEGFFEETELVKVLETKGVNL